MQPKSNNDIEASRKPDGGNRRKHLIRQGWIRKPLKIFGCLLLFIILLPVIIYIPPVQSFLKDMACRIVSNSTGMHVEIERFRLKFPLDVQLDGVCIIEQSGDTMVTAKSLVADLKLKPLLKLDAQINRLELNSASFRMLSADSSMLLKLRAGFLRTDPGSNFDLNNMHLSLRNPVLRDATVSVGMNVWKQKKDTASSPTKFLIEADRMQLENVTFAMSMLPTIDTLNVRLAKGMVTDARINLTDNLISLGSAEIDGGNATYLTPTAEYVKAHPAPVDTTPSSAPPMTIRIGKASLKLDSVLYATVGARPAPGFDPSYILVTGLNTRIDSLFNQGSVLQLPIRSLAATERSGLQIKSASGNLKINPEGLDITGMNISSPSSRINLSATLPFELMAMQPDAPAGTVNLLATIGWSDIFSFMPSLKPMVTPLLGRNLSPLVLSLQGSGSMQLVNITNLDLTMGMLLNLKASGEVSEPTDFSRMKAALNFNGEMRDPSAAMHLIAKLVHGDPGFRIPSLKITGDAQMTPGFYNADFSLLTSAGDLAAKGKLSMKPENYEASMTFTGLQLNEIMPSLGLGRISGELSASGSGFNPMLPRAVTHVKAHMHELSYNGVQLAPLSLTASADRGIYDLLLSARAPHFNLDIDGSGHLQAGAYFADVNADITYLDLHALGLMTLPCRGSGNVTVNGNFNPSSMMGDVRMNVAQVDWEYDGEFYSLPEAFKAALLSDEQGTQFNLDGDEISIDFLSQTPLKGLLTCFDKLMPVINEQMKLKQVDFASLQEVLPHFELNMDASGSGLLHELLEGTGYSLSSLKASFSNTDHLSGNACILSASTGSMLLDTITLDLNQREKLMDYRLHLGNRAPNLPEFAQVNLTGYVGGNRASAFLHQRNAAGETGYRLGLTAAMGDSALSLHLTPLKAVIAYKDWEINEDNYIDLGPGKKIGAMLEASSGGSSISLHSSESAESHPALDVDIHNLLIQDFLQMALEAPPLQGAINSKMHLVYRGTSVAGSGNIGIKGLTYDRQRVGDVDFNFKAGMGFQGNTGASLSLLLNQKEVLTARGFFINDSTALKSGTVKQRAKLSVELNRFPLDIANPFIGADMLQLAGHLNGSMELTGSLSAPLLNGELQCDSVGIYLPMAASWFRFDDKQTIAVADNVLNFDNFNIHAAGKNPLTLNGSVDARKLADINFDLSLNGSEVALINNKRSSGADIYGSLFVTMAIKAIGSTSRMNVDGSLSVLPATNLFYNLSTTASSAIAQQGNTTDLVKFVQFADTTASAPKDSTLTSSMAMRVTASLNIVSGASFTVNLSGNGTDKVQISPSGSLSYLQTYMGDMRLNGTIDLGEGMARYSVKVIGEKSFSLVPGSYVTWTGDIMNPALHINATDHLKANVQQEGANSRLIYFDVGLAVMGTLNAPKVTFDLSTEDDLTVQNELLAMSSEQRSAAAINLLLYNTYTGPGVKASANLGGNPLYTFLEGQLNSLAAKYITGVDLSFGIDQYDKTVNGETSGTTSYSYQVSKSLFDNRFKIVVGGNYSTDANADENFAQNLISDISFEYSLRQTANTSMYVRLFRHTGFESILEGEITETGVGFVMKRKLANLRSLFRLGRKKKKEQPDSIHADSQPQPRWQKVELPTSTPDTL